MTHTTYTQQALFVPFVDEVSAESRNHTTEQAQNVAPEELTVVEISFYDHEVYAGDKRVFSTI